ncbi:MAG: hypothetical protein LBU70_01245 [Chitinispirillales bacterium]|jgi:chorismate mutase|nr:hypothetical protein [Chitinispirillales bacterium]
MTRQNLDHIASRLESLEESIIHRLIDRAQWHLNEVAYAPGLSGFTGDETRSLFELRFYHHEKMDAKFGRFSAPEERPLNLDLPQPQRIVNIPETGLHIRDFNSVNIMQTILRTYHVLLPNICLSGDDGQYGSSVEHDVYAVQAIARRIHYGAFYVAESKFRADVDGYTELIKKRDVDALMKKLTREEVENKIINRVKNKVKRLQAKINTLVRNTIKPEPIIVYFKNFIIPTTKQGQVMYLLNREER